jgi:hypothetical protein
LLFAIASNFFFVVPTFFSDFSITSPMNLGRAGMGWAGRYVSYGNFVNLFDGGAIYHTTF